MGEVLHKAIHRAENHSHHANVLTSTMSILKLISSKQSSGEKESGESEEESGEEREMKQIYVLKVIEVEVRIEGGRMNIKERRRELKRRGEKTGNKSGMGGMRAR